ncbi:MAG: UDP-N-acetylmuramoyl-tripeptide--D-alanyl-D-alanine ligase [Bacteroidales bacterium]|nr:UDP-N-acetylmuramoyl-tripeptide--D-alanyl-D-alanine ligase [Bacteroidales bacterium]
MTALIITFIVLWVTAWVLYLRFYLQMFQQNSNRRDRFLLWLKDNPYPRLFGKSKVKFVMTKRMVRLTITSTLLAVVLTLAPWFFGVFWLSALIILFCPFVLCIADWINSPIEKAINNWYIKDARRKLAAYKDLIVIGVTGSYGKTSTKNYLYRILSEKYNVLMTPGNFNTTLGVVRTIREKLEPFHQVFIVEMGAKEVGDIKEICDLVHPTIGIVTAVGEMHLETFGSFENIQKTKFELIDSLPVDGFGVVNLESPGIASYGGIRTDCKIARFGIDAHRVDVRAASIEYAPGGMEFDVIDAAGSLHLKTQLLGEANILDLTGAIVIAKHLGIPDRSIALAVSKIQPVEHRLSMSRRGSITILDDAYNSNPTGAAMALGVLASMKLPEGGRRICVTPGFVELGTRQADACRELGALAARSCDILIIVNKYNRDAILAGARSVIVDPFVADAPRDDKIDVIPSEAKESLSDRVLCVDTLSEAVAALQVLATPGSAILYENDLPDTFK